MSSATTEVTDGNGLKHEKVSAIFTSCETVLKKIAQHLSWFTLPGEFAI